MSRLPGDDLFWAARVTSDFVTMSVTLYLLSKLHFTSSSAVAERPRDASCQGPFIATQLDVVLSCVGEVSIATPTQLSSTDLLRADWLYAATGSVALPIVGNSGVVRVSIAMQLYSTQLDVELSYVAINGP